jgi:hypothetical protein
MMKPTEDDQNRFSIEMKRMFDALDHMITDKEDKMALSTQVIMRMRGEDPKWHEFPKE